MLTPSEDINDEVDKCGTALGVIEDIVSLCNIFAMSSIALLVVSEVFGVNCVL